MTLGIIDKLRKKDMLRKAEIFFDNRLDFIRGPVELKSMIDHGEEINIIDVRRPEDYNQGHIPGAVNLPQEEWSTFQGLSKDRPNVVYCYTVVCQLATKAAKYFVEHEFPVIELQGGFDYWKKNELPVES